MTTLVQYRIFVGPRYLPDSDGAHYDYSAHDGGAADSLTYSSTLAAQLNSGATSLTLADGTGFPTAGGLWVGPNGSTQSWEYCGFTGRTGTSVTGLVRESTTYREGSGVHSSGATVKVWYELSNNDGNLLLSRRLTPNLCASYWAAEVSGFMAPSNVLRNDHICIVQRRTTFSGSWVNWLVGFVSDAKITDDEQGLARWSFTINSIHKILSTQESKGITLGDMDVAKYGQAISSDVLGSAFKERYSGDYLASDPTFEAKNAINPDPDLMWIADRTVGTEVAITSAWEGVTQLYIRPNAGRGPAYKWVELTNFSTESEKFVTYNPTNDYEYLCDFDDYDPGEDYRIILTTDPYTFLAENPAYVGHRIIDVTTLTEGSNVFDGLAADGGACGIKGLMNYRNCIRWGTCSSFPDGSGAEGTDWDFNDNWTGDAIDSPDFGETLRFDYSVTSYTNDNERWIVGYQNSPGYQINEDGDDAWWAVVLPGIGLYARDDISIGSVSDIYVVDSTGQPSTNGLPNGGYIQIGDDHIIFTSKDSEKLTGISGVSSAHSAGDKIYVKAPDVATDGPPIKSITITYPGANYADKFYLRWSSMISRVPSQSEHENDYQSPYGATLSVPTDQAAASPFTYTLGGTTEHIKTLLLEFRNMVTDPSRPRLLRVECNLDTSYYDSDLWLDSSETVGQTIKQILENCSVPTGAITVSAGTAVVEGITTATDRAWTVLTDLAEFGGCFVNVTQASKIVISPETLFSTAVGGYTADYTLTKTEIAKAEKVFVRGNGVNQVRLKWIKPDGSEDGTRYYPSSASWQGLVHEEGPLAYASSTAADLAAEKKYFILKYPYTILTQLAEGNLNVAPGDVVNVEWQFTDSFGQLDRLYLVTSVDQSISGGFLTTVVNGLQIDREVEF